MIKKMVHEEEDSVFKRVLEWVKPVDGILTSKNISREIHLLEDIRGANMCDMVRAHKLVNDMRTVLVYINKQEEPRLKKWWFY